MVINWYGEGCFKLQSNGVTLLTDPIDSSTGLSAPRGQVDIVIKTLMKAPTPLKELEPVLDESTRLIIGPGEHEIKGVNITGWPLQKDSGEGYIKSIFLIKIDELTIGLLGHITEFNEPEILEELGKIDILIIPAGGKPFIEQSAAAKLVRQINPNVVIPSFFKVKGLKRKADTADKLFKEIGIKAPAPAEKYSVKKKDMVDKAQIQAVVLGI